MYADPFSSREKAAAWKVDIAAEVDRLLRDYEAMEFFKRQVVNYVNERLQLCSKRDKWSEERREYAIQNGRPHDFSDAAKPLTHPKQKQGWKYDICYFVGRERKALPRKLRDAATYGNPDTVALGAFFPPKLKMPPDVEPPLPVRNRKLSLTEKAASLAAIYNAAGKGEPIEPWPKNGSSD